MINLAIVKVGDWADQFLSSIGGGGLGLHDLGQRVGLQVVAQVFHFYAGGPVRMLQLCPDGGGREVLLGADVLAGQQPQVIVPRGVWQGALLEPGGDFALLGCTVAPGFEYADYEHGDQAALIKQYPEFTELITRLTSPS